MIQKRDQLNSIELHYIVGLGRSGTTLLSSTIGSHDNVLSTPESLFLLYYLHIFRNKKEFTKKEIDEFIERIFTLQTGKFVSLRLWLINKEKLREDLYALLPSSDFSRIAKSVYLNCFLAEGKNNIQFIIDKNPPYTLHIEKLLNLPGNSKFIGLVRDYRDNAISRNKYQLDSINTVIYHGITWNYYNKELLRMKSKYPDKIMLIRYEDLVANFDSTMVSVHLFLGIENNESETLKNNSYFEKITGILNEEEKKWFLKMHGRIREKVDSSKAGLWKKTMKRGDILLLEKICGDTGKYFSYEISQPNEKIKVADRIRLLRSRIWFYFETRIHHWYYKSPLWLRDFAARMKRIFRRKDDRVNS